MGISYIYRYDLTMHRNDDCIKMGKNVNHSK